MPPYWFLNMFEKLLGLVYDFHAFGFELFLFALETFGCDGVEDVDHIAALGCEFLSVGNGHIGGHRTEYGLGNGSRLALAIFRDYDFNLNLCLTSKAHKLYIPDVSLAYIHL